MTTTIREHPIIFSAPMVRAILDGAKTQTRRIITARNCDIARALWDRMVWEDADAPEELRPAVVPDHGMYGEGVGYGKVLMRPHPSEPQEDPGHWTRQRVPSIWAPGDRLWVREAVWIDREPMEVMGRKQLRCFRDDGTMCFEDGTSRFSAGREPWTDWTPELRRADYRLYGSLKMVTARFMPRWASRITLEVVRVRVERVQEISEADARAEGCDGNCGVGYIPAHQAGPHSYHFAQLWDSINAKRDGGRFAWANNPWVWAIEFRRVGEERASGIGQQASGVDR